MSARRWAWAEIDLDAIEHNIGLLRERAAPADVWAVVKADGYGHGAVRVAESALRAGAAGLCVALLEEGVELRMHGIEAPILVLSQQPDDQLAELIDHGLTPTVYTAEHAATLASVAGDRTDGGYGVHVKIDTGMQRVGIAPADTAALIESMTHATPSLRVDAVYTHLACADEPESDGTRRQLDAFDEVLVELDRRGLRPALEHAANSAATLAVPDSRRSLVRAGIAIYGVSPAPGLDHLVGDLRPALSLRARVSFIKPVAAGTHVSYGWRHRFASDTVLATVPIGYADGVPRRLGTLPDAPGADVLVHGRRCPIVGVVTMDQLMVDVGAIAAAGGDVSVGDEVVLIGAQGHEIVRAEEWAARLGTIGYEIVCGIGRRVPRIERPIR